MHQSANTPHTVAAARRFLKPVAKWIFAIALASLPFVAVPGAAAPAGSAPEGKPMDVVPLLLEHNCLECHAADEKMVGPTFRQIITKYADKPDRVAELARSIRAGGKGKWGTDAMPPFGQLSEAEAKALAQYVLAQ